jgi:SAM-dependent methyltransferase
MSHNPSKLLLSHLDLLTALDRSLPVLDLACGSGRNGLILAGQGINVVFADKSVSALKVVERRLLEAGLTGRLWQIDLELLGVNPFSGDRYAAVLGFCYLHRPLFPLLKKAVMPGGLVVYETFTTAQRQFGRPNNPDFLLRLGELEATFNDWELIHHFEGIRPNPDRGIARIVARRPEVGKH